MTRPLYAPRVRAERLIAGGRLVLSISSLFAVWLDPHEPVRFAPVAYAVLWGYLIYAAAVAALLWRRDTLSQRWSVATHATDLVCFSLFILFTEGPASPFTVYFVFALLSATLRWQVRGATWTALIIVAAFFGFGIYFGLFVESGEFDLRGLIIRGVYLIVLAVLLRYVGTQDQRTLQEMWGLATWPQTVRRDLQALTEELLAYAAQLMHARRLVLAWTEVDAPWQQIATWHDGQCTHQRHPADEPLVHESVRDRAFIRSLTPTPRTLVQDASTPQLASWPDDAVGPRFARQFAAEAIVSVPLGGESFAGRLFVLERPDATLDDLLLAEIVAGVIASRLDACYLIEQLRQSAATEERIRLARDLHDGVLQSFTGIALRIPTMRRMLHADPDAAAAALDDLQRVLAAEQRELRFFIQELRPAASPWGDVPLSRRLADLVQTLEREWDLRVDLQVSAAADRLPAALLRDVYHLVREALVNAARHGAASRARVVVVPDVHAIEISIVDNGQGFPFSGRYSEEQLAALNLGPKTLRERVRALNGRLTLDSSGAGAELNMVVPLEAAA